MISQHYLREIFDYRDGALYWKHDATKRPQWNAQRAGKAAGGDNQRGYIVICMRPSAQNGFSQTKYLLAHRLIFCLHHGHYPTEVDHINGNPSDNRIQNLRAASRYENSANARTAKNNTTGTRGICKKKNGTYEARISFYGKRHQVGTFPDFATAAQAQDTAASRILGEWKRIVS